MFYLYLLKKYKSPCFLIEATSGDFWEILGINLKIREFYYYLYIIIYILHGKKLIYIILLKLFIYYEIVFVYLFADYLNKWKCL